jgi:cytochrome bd-type quinol oxidase subunit 2
MRAVSETNPPFPVLPVGHRARSAAMRALWVSVAGAGAFTVFARVTTQDKSVRTGSPWQNAPYDGMLPFTEFLVPALAVLIVAAALALQGRAFRRRPSVEADATRCCWSPVPRSAQAASWASP